MKLPNYKPRLIDERIKLYLATFGALLLEGPKWCGKTWSAKNACNSEFLLSDPTGNFNNRQLAITDPKGLAEHCMEDIDSDFVKKVKAGDIIVAPETTNEMLSQMRAASGLIVEQKGDNSHAAIVGLTLDIPVIVGADNATDILKDGAVVLVDAETGTVSSNS